MKKSSRDYRKHIRIGKANYREQVLFRRKFFAESGKPDDGSWVVCINLGINDVWMGLNVIPYNWKKLTTFEIQCQKAQDQIMENTLRNFKEGYDDLVDWTLLSQV